MPTPDDLSAPLLPEQLESLVLTLCSQRVLLSPHLAPLYGVEVRRLIQAVKRNPERFPADFMFKLTKEEAESLRSQFVISNEADTESEDFKSQTVIWSGVGTRATPYAFTEQGVAMLSSVLRSPRAVAVNIEIMRVLVRLRYLLADNKDLALRLGELELSVKTGFEQSDRQFADIFNAIRQLMTRRRPAWATLGFDPWMS